MGNLLNSEFIGWIAFAFTVLISGGGWKLIKAIIKDIKDAIKEIKELLTTIEECKKDGFTPDEIEKIGKEARDVLHEIEELTEKATKLWKLLSARKKANDIKKKIKDVKKDFKKH